MLRMIIDPNVAHVRTPPKDERDLAIGGANSYIVSFDNVSCLPVWFADGLCRIATGSGFASRTLYTDDDETVLQVCRPVILNGIEDFATRGDVVDRLVPVQLQPITEERRRTEAEIWREFEELQPGLLGWLFDVVAAGLRTLPTVKLAKAPRMADFAYFAVACESALGIEPGVFLRSFASAKRTAEGALLDNSLVAQAIIKVLQRTPAPLMARPQQLLTQLSDEMMDNDRRNWRWPKTARGLTGELKRIAPALRASEGIGVEFLSARGNGHMVEIRWLDGHAPESSAPTF